MKSETKRICLCLVLLAFLVSIVATAFSLARYSSEEEPGGDYTGDFEYILSDKINISSVEDFFTAIENGYNYIQLDDTLADPLIITGSMSNIRDDLTIDLNGHEIRRNNRDPLLSVGSGLTLTIIDSKGGGSLYNPVGSVIQVNGGTLTVAEGIFESGPRGENSRNDVNNSAVQYNEYAIYSGGNSWTTPGGGSISGTKIVELFKRGESGYTQITATGGGNVDMPIIAPKPYNRPTTDGSVIATLNGNMYFDVGSTVSYGNDVVAGGIITNDTYLYFTFTADNIQHTAISSNTSADYYYTYYVKGAAVDESTDVTSSDTQTGSGTDGDIDFAYACASEEDAETGNILVTVYVYNDVKPNNESNDDTIGYARDFAAIKMESGDLFLRGGDFYSYFGVANTYCVDASGGYMSVNEGAFYAYENAVCVECEPGAQEELAATRNEVLYIANGSFYSERGDTIRVDGGNMTIDYGVFTKSEGNDGASSSAVEVSNGVLTIAESATFRVNGSNVYGIYAMNNADVTIGGKIECIVEMDGSVTELSSAAIFVDGGHLTFNLDDEEGQQSSITSNGLGIVVFGGNITLSSGSLELTTSRATAIYMTGGSVNVNKGTTLNVESTINEGCSWATAFTNDTSPNIYNGVYIVGGSLTADGALNVTHRDAE